MKPYKRGYRCLGIAECFRKGAPFSILCGVVMRRDLVIDGAAFSTTTVGGLDATSSVLELYRVLNRRDINCLMLNGCIISWYNIVDLEAVYKATGVPLICVTYEESPGLEVFFKKYFGDADVRIEMYRRLGGREQVYLKRTGAKLFIRYHGITRRDAEAVLNSFTLHGKTPEPLRVARLIARGALEMIERKNFGEGRE